MTYEQLKILTSLPLDVPAGMNFVTFSRKSTKDNPVEEKDKFRAVMVPDYTLPKLEEGTDAIFGRAISDAFYNAAGEILRAYVESNKDATEINGALLAFSAVVAKMQEQVTSKRMNGAQIKEWYEQSQTSKDSAARYGVDDAGKKKQEALKAHYISLASNNPGIQPSLAVKMLGYISEQDTGHAVTKQVAEKLAALSKKDTSDDL